MPASTGDDWMGTTAAAAYLGLTLRTLYRLMDEGDIPAYKMGRVLRLRRVEVDRFIDRSRIQPGELAHLYPPTVRDGARDRMAEDSEPDKGSDEDEEFKKNWQQAIVRADVKVTPLPSRPR